MSTSIPALKPPPGVISNFEKPQSLSYRSNIAIGISLPLITFFFLARSYVRIWVKRTWIIEDWLTFLAWGGNVAFDALVAATMSHHGGKHGWDITIAEAHDASYWFNVSSITYAVAICITKIAVLYLYRRVFSPQRKSFFDLTIVSLMVVFILYYGCTVFIKICECIPRSKAKHDTVTGSCTDIPKVLNADGVFNTVTDTIILFLPVKAVWHLSIEKQRKIIVVLVFTFGLCAPIFSIVGFIVRLRISNNPDTTWNQPEILLWAGAELTTGNLCVCFPEMARLFRKSEKSRPNAQNLGGMYKLSQSRGAMQREIQNGCDQDNLQHGGVAHYLELGENDTYGVQIMPAQKSSREEDFEGVHVTSEIAIESHTI